MIPVIHTREQALKIVNYHRTQAGLGSIGMTTFSELRNVYARMFPKSKWVNGERLMYGEPVILVMYFLSRLHSQMKLFSLTEMAARQIARSLPTKSFSDSFQTYSDVNTFFENGRTQTQSQPVAA